MKIRFISPFMRDERGTHEELIGERGRYYQLYTGNAIG